MEPVGHCFWGGKLFGAEIKIAVVVLPIVVDHKYADGESMLYYVVGIFFYIRLVLVVHQFYPRVVLWHRKKHILRDFSGRIKIHFRRAEIRVLQSFVGYYRLDLLKFAFDCNNPAFNGKFKRLVAPNIPSF